MCPDAAYYYSHKQKCLEYSKMWYKTPKGRETKRKKDRRYYERKREQILKSRARVNYQRREHQKIFDMLGNECFLCGNDDVRVLELHHWNGKTKRDANYANWRKNDLADLVLLCGNCHNLVHWKKRHVF